ncbi:MAG TPA: hypothetical protein VIY27_10005 [Myxococcota bacterium]
MSARTAIVWVATLAGAFGLGWWAASPPGVAPERMAALIDQALDEAEPLARARLISRVCESLDATNVEEAMRVIEAEPRITESEIRLFMYAWTRFDPEAAFNAARHSKQNLIRREGAAAATYHWAQENPKAALYWVETIEDKTFREFLTENLITGWVLSGERESAAFYIAGLPRGTLRKLQTTLLLQEYLKEGPEAAVRWADSLPESAPVDYRHEVFQRVAKQVAMRDPELAGRWIAPHLGQNYARNTLRLIANEWLEQDPPNALEWLLSLPDDPQRDRILFTSFNRWYDIDALSAQKWLEAEAIEAVHDPVLEAFARRLSERAPRKAVYWAEMIQDAARRERALVLVGQNWYRKSPDAARAWAAESTLSEQARAAVLNPPTLGEGAQTEEDLESLEDGLDEDL